MSFENLPDESTFIINVAAIFEENCLPLIKSEKDLEKGLLIAIDYCLDILNKKKPR